MGSEHIIDHVDIGWPVRKNWPFAKKFDDIINRAVENGFVQYWMNRLMEGEFGWDDEALKVVRTSKLCQSGCVNKKRIKVFFLFWQIPELYTSYLHKRERRVKDIDPSLIFNQKFIPLSIEHLNVVFYAYSTGILISIFVFLMEILFAITYKTGNVIRAACRDKFKKFDKKPNKSTCTKIKDCKLFRKLTQFVSKNEKFETESSNELDKHFKVRKTVSLIGKEDYSILLSDFSQCFDKYGRIKLVGPVVKQRRKLFA